RDGLQRRGISRECNRPVGEIEPVRQRRPYRRMLDECRGDSDMIVLHDRSRRRHFLHHRWHERLDLQILHPEIDRRLVGSDETPAHLCERRRPERLHRRRQALDPPDQEEWTVLDVVVGMMMMKIERTAVNGIPLRANWFVTPSPQSSTYALSLLSMMCDVMYRERFGTLGF